MTYDVQKKVVGRKPVTIIELDLDFCDNTYGVLPCQAAVGITGQQKCFNTFSSCQDPANYARGVKTYRFCTPSAEVPTAQLGLIPNVEKVDFIGTRLESRGIGLRAGVTVKLNDHPHHDRGIDPYVSSRTYDPFKTGTFWGKMRARNQYYWARTMRVKTGYITDPWDDANFTTRTYIIDTISGPDADGTVTIKGKDPLRLTDDTRSLAPVATSGLLSADLLAATTASLTLIPAGSGLDYAASGHVVIGNEVIQYASKTGDTLNTLTRGTRGTSAQDHQINDKVQQALTFDNIRVEQVVRTLLVDYAKIDSSFIPIADWTANADLWLSNSFITTTIIKPEGVQTLLEELSRDFMFLLWWDEEDAKVKFQAISPLIPTTVPPLLNDNANFLKDSLQVEDIVQDRVSRVLVYYALLDPTKSLSDTTNFRGLYVNVNADMEGPNAYNKEAVYEVRSRWIPSFDSAITLGGRTINRFKRVLQRLKFKLDARDKDVWVGDIVDVRTRAIQAATGEDLLIRMQIMEVKESVVGHTLDYTAMAFGEPLRIGLITPDLYLGSPFPDYSAATDDLKAIYLFIAPDSGVFSDGTPAYVII